MRAEVEKRVEELRAEFEAGQKVLADLDGKRAEVQQTLLRISGALQVLTELLDAEVPAEPEEPAPPVTAVG